MNNGNEVPPALLAAFARTITPEGVARARQAHAEMWLTATLGETPATPLPVWRPR